MKKLAIFIILLIVPILVGGCTADSYSPPTGTGSTDSEPEHFPAETELPEELELDGVNYLDRIDMTLSELKAEIGSSFDNVDSAKAQQAMLDYSAYTYGDSPDANVFYCVTPGQDVYQGIPSIYKDDFSKIGDIHVTELIGQVGLIFPEFNHKLTAQELLAVLRDDAEFNLHFWNEYAIYSFEYNGYLVNISMPLLAEDMSDGEYDDYSNTENYPIYPNYYASVKRYPKSPDEITKTDRELVYRLWEECYTLYPDEYPGEYGPDLEMIKGNLIG